MTDLKIAKERHVEYIKRQKEWLKYIAAEYEDCGFDGDNDNDNEDGLEDLLNMIREGDIQLSGLDDRDGLYLEDVLRCNEILIIALRDTFNTDKKAQHTNRKRFESVIKTARAIKDARDEDIRKAKEVIDIMDEIISVCEKYN